MLWLIVETNLSMIIVIDPLHMMSIFRKWPTPPRGKSKQPICAFTPVKLVGGQILLLLTLFHCRNYNRVLCTQLHIWTIVHN